MTINSITQNIWNTIFAGSPPQVNPKFKDYHCFAIKDAPWQAGHDINKDGWFGVDDMKAIMQEKCKVCPPYDANLERLEKKCRQIKVGDIPKGVSWQLREAVDGFKAGGIQRSEAIAKIDTIKTEAIEELESYRNEFRDYKMMRMSNCELLDLTMQAKEIVNSEKDGYFGVGVTMKDVEISGLTLFEILNVYPKGPAAGRLFKGDVVFKINDKRADTYPGGTRDSEMGMTPGLGGHYNSAITYSVMRPEDEGFKLIDIALQRTTWAAAPTNCEEHPHTWDGTVKYQDEPTEEEPKSSGCSASPAKTSACIIGWNGKCLGSRLWDGDLGEWIYDVTH